RGRGLREGRTRAPGERRVGCSWPRQRRRGGASARRGTRRADEKQHSGQRAGEPATRAVRSGKARSQRADTRESTRRVLNVVEVSKGRALGGGGRRRRGPR